ncbi:beta-galactosidase [Microbacterium sediminicola]|uniref:Beta-galactosidase n=1 Tax=Microbacterium sediminicola TaxID=415210 RepID=A0ABN2I989_9MICO
MTTFTIGDTDFLLDGEPYQILSGAIHYFRVHPDQWADRIHKARLMGLNTIETYVSWNTHEPVRGEWDSTGWNDLGRFLDLVAAEGMHAIVRPGPYICAEWANGGLPTWLTTDTSLGLRSSEPGFVREITRFLENIYEIVTPRQIDRGGNVILVQIENEYGAYGADKAYLEELVRVTRAAGITVPLTTVDQPQPDMLRNGSLPGVLHLTGSFGSRASERLATLREFQPTGPLMCSEFWDGWFDWWGSNHHTTSPEVAAQDLDDMLAAGASVNFYMFHGGTNFGLMNGANDKGRYSAITTSYDYDAPLDEAGNPNAKFWAFREVIAKYAPVPDEVPADPTAAPILEVPLEATGDWLAPLVREIQTTEAPATFEQLGQDGALVLYAADAPAGLFAVDEVRDLAWASVDGTPVGRMSRREHEHTIALPSAGRLELLVEDQGRINYASRIGEHKGLIGVPTVDGAALTGWTATPIDVTAVAASVLEAAPAPAAAAYSGTVGLRASFTLDAASDLFLDTDGFGKGYAFINGFFLGRYWQNGPQRTLFVPGPATRAGENTVVIVELENVTIPSVRFLASAELGYLED